MPLRRLHARVAEPALEECARSRDLVDYTGTLTDRQRHTNRWIAEAIVAWHAWTLDRDRIGSSA